MVPSNETTLVISDLEMAKRYQLKEQSAVVPHKGLRFNPIYMESGKVSINMTKTNPSVPPVQHSRHKVPIEYKAEIEKELDKMVQQGIISKQTELTPWVSSLTYLKKPNGKLRICLDPKDLNKAIICENHKAPTLEIAHILTGATNLSKVDDNKAFLESI